jgi:hypothetical protein
MEIRRSSMLMFLTQAVGLGLVLAVDQIVALYAGFLLYGVGLGGGWVFARTNLGKLFWPRVARHGTRPRHSCYPRFWRRGARRSLASCMILPAAIGRRF